MPEKTKAAIAYFLSAGAYIAFGIDKLTAVDISDGISLAIVIVGAIASAYGIAWTAPSRTASARRLDEARHD